MWVLLGVLAGIVVGNIVGDVLRVLIGGHGMSFSLAVLGAIVGGVLGKTWHGGEASKNAGDGAGRVQDRVKKLEKQVDWLYRESLSLRQELASLRAAVPGVGPVEGAPATASPEAAAPIAAGEEVASASVSDQPATAASMAAKAAAEADTRRVEAVSASRPLASAARPATSPASPREAESASDEIDLAGLWGRIIGGNPLAKIGVVLLFFGVASALRLAAEYGLFPVPLRLFLAAAGGVGLIAFGLRKAEDALRRNFGLAIQGGGFAVLYLVVYFMLARYDMLGASVAFVLFAALGVACVLLAARQDGPALAVFGMAGAFLAPVLAGERAESPLMLFSYFTLLNVFILVIDWRRAWQVLNIVGFMLTLVIGMAWAVGGYRPEHYAVTQFFLIVFMLMYSATPVAAALLSAPGFAGWRNGMLVFGVPLAGAFLQSRLMADVPYGLAWSALFASLYYFGLWAMLFRRRVAEAELIERSHLGLAIAFLTVSVPLAFGAQVTSAFWAAEGAAVMWFGARMRRMLAQVTGLGMQVIAGLALLQGWDSLSIARPLFNDAVLGGALIATAGIASARLLRALGDAASVPPALPFVWAALWWLGMGLGEIDRFAAFANHAPYGLLFVSGTVLLLEAVAKLWQWPQARRAAILLLPAMWVATAMTQLRADHPLAGMMLLALPLAYVVHAVLLLRHLPDVPPGSGGDRALLLGVRHVGGWWLALFVLPMELGWLASELAPGRHVWPALAWGLVWAGSLLVVAEAHQRGWPRLTSPWFAVRGGALLPVAGLLTWSVLVSAFVAGDGSGLPYLPLLNPVDLAQLFAFYVLWRLAQAFPDWRSGLHYALAVAGFVWWSTLPGRIVHHLWGVPFTWGALWDQAAFQALLTLLWTVTAIALMIRAAKGDGDDAAAVEARRRHWFAGFALLVVVGAKMLLVDAVGAGTLAWTGTLLGVAVLVLAASYFAPLPPRAGTPRATNPGGGRATAGSDDTETTA